MGGTDHLAFFLNCRDLRMKVLSSVGSSDVNRRVLWFWPELTNERHIRPNIHPLHNIYIYISLWTPNKMVSGSQQDDCCFCSSEFTIKSCVRVRPYKGPVCRSLSYVKSDWVCWFPQQKQFCDMPQKGAGWTWSALGLLSLSIHWLVNPWNQI